MSVWRKHIEIIILFVPGILCIGYWILSGESNNKCFQDLKTIFFYSNDPIESHIFKWGRLKGDVQPDSN